MQPDAPVVIASDGDLALVRSGDRWGTTHDGVTWAGDPVEWHESERDARRAYAQDRGACEVCDSDVETFGDWRCIAHPEATDE